MEMILLDFQLFTDIENVPRLALNSQECFETWYVVLWISKHFHGHDSFFIYNRERGYCDHVDLSEFH